MAPANRTKRGRGTSKGRGPMEVVKGRTGGIRSKITEFQKNREVAGFDPSYRILKAPTKTCLALRLSGWQGSIRHIGY